MKVFKVPKRDERSHKKITGERTVVLTRDPASDEPFKVQIRKGQTLLSTKTFVNKSNAEQWAELNAPGVPIKDLTGDGKIRSQVCSE